MLALVYSSVPSIRPISRWWPSNLVCVWLTSEVRSDKIRFIRMNDNFLLCVVCLCPGVEFSVTLTQEVTSLMSHYTNRLPLPSTLEETWFQLKVTPYPNHLIFHSERYFGRPPRQIRSFSQLKVFLMNGWITFDYMSSL